MKGTLLLSVALAIASPAWAQKVTQAPFRINTTLVLVDILVEDKKTGEAVDDLRQQDFDVRDNGKPVSVSSFADGKAQNPRPLQLWFVLACNEHFVYAGRGNRSVHTANVGSAFGARSRRAG